MYSLQERSMAQLENVGKSGLVRGIAIGLGAAVLIPVAAKAVAPFIRPATRSVLKFGLVAFEKAREAAGELSETVEDMAAEVREELRAERAAGEAATTPEEEVAATAAPSANEADTPSNR
jgi:hypothetical protein